MSQGTAANKPENTVGVAPVVDWETDFDPHDPAWKNDPFPIWDELRSGCPVAHTERYNEGVWLPTRFEDITAIAHDTDTFSSEHDGISAGGTVPRPNFPPIHTDPPDHLAVRRAILPFFTPQRIAQWEPNVRAHCEHLAASLQGCTDGDAAADYAEHIPVAAIAAILGIDPDDGDLFREWVMLIAVGDNEPERRIAALQDMSAYFAKEIERRRATPGEDLISHLLQADLDGEALPDDMILRILTLQLVAGIDTTWSVLGSSLWHLAQHPEDRRRLVEDPSLIPNAVEEFLRAFASVSVFRKVIQPSSVAGVSMEPGDTVMMAFPAACRDPREFDNADEVDIERARNRHVAFGAGIHRCLGSNLARLELNVAIETWLKFIPDFELQPDADVTWSGGGIRGPRQVPVNILGAS